MEMDSFTQKLLERTQARREAINAKFAQIPQPMPRKRRSPLKEDDVNRGLSTGSGHHHLFAQEKNSCDDDSPGKRHCSHDKRQDSKENNDLCLDPVGGTEVAISLSNDVVKSADDDDGGLLRSKTKAEITPANLSAVPQLTTPNSCSRSTRLAALAANINNWEDESCPRSSGSGHGQQLNRPHESNSTPPQSSCEGSSLSSTSVTRTPSSSSERAAPPPPLPILGTPVVTPKLNLMKTDVVAPSIDRLTNKTVKARDPTPKKVVWDRAIVATLEAQGFVKSPSKSKLEYDFKGKNSKTTSGNKNTPSSAADSDSGHEENVPPLPLSRCVADSITTKRSVKDLAKKFDTPSSMISNPTLQKDPAELPLSARVAMFEKSSNAQTVSSIKKPVSVTSSSSPIHSAKRTTSERTQSPYMTPLPKEETKSEGVSLSPTKVGRHTFEIHRRLFENADKNWKSNEIASKVKEDRQKDMEVVLNRWSYSKKVLEPKSSCNSGEKAEYRILSSTSSSSCNRESVNSEDERSSDGDLSNDDESVEGDDNRHIPEPPPMPTSSPVKLGLQQEEGDESGDCSSEDSYDCLSDRAVQMKAVENVTKVFSEIDELSTDSDVDEECDSLQVVNEAIQNGTDFDSSILNAAFQRIKPSRTEESVACDAPRCDMRVAMPATRKHTRQPSLSCDPNFEASKEELPLMHTVSFYRRQKDVNKTPVKIIIRKEEVPSPISPRSPPYLTSTSTSHDAFRAFIQDKIKELQEDANAQLIIMSQASQALNLCRSTAEFHGSAEQIEGERLLLISSQRRQACLNEIQRLKTEGVLGGESPNGSVMSKGSLTLGEMKLSLKREFLTQTDSGKSVKVVERYDQCRSLENDRLALRSIQWFEEKIVALNDQFRGLRQIVEVYGEFVHYFVCLVKHRGQVIATQMVSTLDCISGGAFHLPNLINVRDLDHDFNVLFEVYGLQTKRDYLSKGRKTLGSRKEKSKLTLTPKKRASKQDSRMTSPAVQSPGGPSAICTSSFSMIGFTMINIKSMQRKQWTLEKVPFVSPLEGNLSMKVQCHTDSHIDEQGFLTMFEDVSGFGAWHRRWFHLTQRYLSFWKYPDDVKRKEPIGRIDLCECVTSEVTLVPRDICARPNTLMLLVVRPPSEDDTNTLVSQSYNTYTSTKVLLSADTKEERILWCQRFNEALTCLRKWDPNALRPIPSD